MEASSFLVRVKVRVRVRIRVRVRVRVRVTSQRAAKSAPTARASKPRGAVRYARGGTRAGDTGAAGTVWGGKAAGTTGALGSRGAPASTPRALVVDAAERPAGGRAGVAGGGRAALGVAAASAGWPARAEGCDEDAGAGAGAGEVAVEVEEDGGGATTELPPGLPSRAGVAGRLGSGAGEAAETSGRCARGRGGGREPRGPPGAGSAACA